MAAFEADFPHPDLPGAAEPADRPGRLLGAALVLTVVVFALVFLFPLYWMVSGGLKSPQEIIQVPPTLLPAHPQLGNYSTAWIDADLGRLLCQHHVLRGRRAAVPAGLRRRRGLRVLQAPPGAAAT